jgi:subtilisin family serine protease
MPTGVRRIGAGTADQVRERSGARVAVIDGKVDLEHPDLDARPGIDCVGDEGPPPAEPDTHGTHVAGIIGARNNGAGVTGLAPGTEVVSVRVLGNDRGGLTSELICGIEWVADPANDIAVANMSLGGLNEDFGTCPDPGDPLHAAICVAGAESVTLVAAAGNDALAFDKTGKADEESGDPRPRYTPAAYPEVLAVTAMSDTDGEPGATGPGVAAARTSVRRSPQRVQLSWSTSGRDRTYEANTRIRDGRWELDDGLPQDVIAALLARDGTVHSYTLFTGYLPARMRGEVQAYQVLGAP